VAARRHAGQEGADPAVLDLARPAAPPPGDAAGVGPRLGEGAGAQGQHRVGVAAPPGDVAAQPGHDGLVVPGAGADEVPRRLAGPAGLVGDRLGGLAPEVAELAPQDGPGPPGPLDAAEARQAAAQEAPRPAAAAGRVGRGNLGIGEQGPGGGVFEQGQPGAPDKSPSSPGL
jgi:hypothetical protein